ncbi:hypothetical protein B0T13DRAFT_91370 [Neurospora crassa]|nr:hypothetical protein B0T13DRAFT_91370 [Neurospora crassa]
MLGAVTPSCVRTLFFFFFLNFHSHSSLHIHTLSYFPEPRFDRICWFRPGSGLPRSGFSVSYKCEACCRVRRQTGNQSNQIATNGWIGFINEE